MCVCGCVYLLTQTNQFILPSSSKVLPETASSLLLENQKTFSLIFILFAMIQLACVTWGTDTTLQRKSIGSRHTCSLKALPGNQV